MVELDLESNLNSVHAMAKKQLQGAKIIFNIKKNSPRVAGASGRRWGAERVAGWVEQGGQKGTTQDPAGSRARTAGGGGLGNRK